LLDRTSAGTGAPLGELGLNAALAAHSGVPPVLVAGDDSVAAEAAEVAPGMRAVVVKQALGARAAALLHPEEACDRIEQEVPKALAVRRRTSRPRTRSPTSSRCSRASEPLLDDPVGQVRHTGGIDTWWVRATSGRPGTGPRPPQAPDTS
jgi:hypothetical protein